MDVALDNDGLKHLRRMLRSGEYYGAYLWLAIDELIDELIELREWRDKAFQAHPNIDIDIEHIDG